MTEKENTKTRKKRTSPSAVPKKTVKIVPKPKTDKKPTQKVTPKKTSSAAQKKLISPSISEPTVSNPASKKSFSWSYLTLLLLCAIILGTAIFFINHPWKHVIFQNPFISQKIHQIKTVLAPTPNASVDYNAYKNLSQNITLENKEAIQNFLSDNPTSSLSMTLRNQWLLFLAEQSDWAIFLDDYEPTNNQAVECYHLRALYNSGQQRLALSGVKRLWLAGYKPSNACNVIFKQWQKSDDFNEDYLWARLQLAIDQKDTASIAQLTQMLSPEKQSLVTSWLAIHKKPKLLLTTPFLDTNLGRRIILDGLKQWANTDVLGAIKYWNFLQKDKYHFDEAATQDFYLMASMHLALNADPQAEIWFAKILPQYSTAQSRAWQVRFALMHQNWPNVLARIQAMPAEEQNVNLWQYWKARALVKTGNPAAANDIYNTLSAQRQYYGFLAAYQQKKALTIQQQNYPQNNALLAPYTQQITQIQQLYNNHQMPQALQLTQDLLHQLDPIGQYTLAHVFAQWGWFSESMNIGNRLPYQSDLKLRFPMPHLSIIQQFCAPAHIAPALIYAIGRQESNFHEDVFSRAGGLGILQLTLTTAKQFDPHITEQALYNPTTNIKISIAYLTRLNKQFEGHPALIASAYNAGPQKTRNWQPTKAPIPADIWIETRPWEETRNYLKNISAYYAVYEYLLGQTPNIDAFMRDIPVNE